MNHERKINLEYAARLQVVKILIKEAEHLMDYLSLVVIEINLSNGEVSVLEETPDLCGRPRARLRMETGR